MLHFLFNNDCILILHFVLFPTGWFVFGNVNTSTKTLRIVTIPEDVLPDLYEKYKEAVEDVGKPESLRRLFKKNKEYKIHVKRLNEVNGYKKHNLLIKQIKRGGPMIYINNPVESKIPHPFLSFEEFKTALSDNVERQREHFTRLRKITIGKMLLRNHIRKTTMPTRTTRNGILLKSTSPVQKTKSNTKQVNILKTKKETDKTNAYSVNQRTKTKKIKSKTKVTKSKLNGTTLVAKRTRSTAFTEHRTTEPATKSTTDFATELTTELITTESTTELTKKPNTESYTELTEVSIKESNTIESNTKLAEELTTESITKFTEESTTELIEKLTTVSTIETEESTTEFTEEPSTESTTTKATSRTLGRPNVWMGLKK